MKNTLLIILLVCFFSHCANRTRLYEVEVNEINQIFKQDKGKLVSWVYIGSDDQNHYFRRTLMAVAFHDQYNGIYSMNKSLLKLGSITEFKRVYDGSTPRETCRVFTKIISDQYYYNINYR